MVEGPLMIKNLLILVILCATIGFLTKTFDTYLPQGSSTAEKGFAEGRRAPDFTFTDIKGKSRRLSDFDGKIVMLNFWASWCPPCVKEFPDLLAVAASMPDDVVLLALSSDFEEAPMNRFLRQLERQSPENYRLPNIIIGMDESAAITQKLYGTRLLPETVLIDKDGIMRRKIAGANWSRTDMQDWVKALD